MKRNISLEDEFMNYGTDDLLWGMLLVKATYNVQKEELYISRSDMLEVKRDYTRGCGISARTTNNRLRKYQELGMITQVIDNTNVYYKLKDKYTKYKLVDYYILKYLVTTKSHNSIKIYTYLLNAYDWKTGQEEMYSFTCKELILALGYSESSSNKGDITTMVNMILKDLKKTGLIDYVEYSDGKTMRKRLTKVVTKKEELQ